jgi:DNA-binding transcriptional MocR family regulator
METTINLSSGQPPEGLLAYDLIKNATNRLLSENMKKNSSLSLSSSPLAYGDQYQFFSKRIASFLEIESGRESIDSELIVPIAGVSNGLDLICTMLCRDLTSARGVAFVEESTYFLSISLFEDHGLLVVPLPTDCDGILIEEFRTILEKMKDDRTVVPLLLYCIPTFHNPTGRTMPPIRRLQLLDLTQEYSLVVVADEVYQFLGFTEYLPNPYRHLDSQSTTSVTIQTYYPSLVSLSPSYDHVLSLSSFSKILGPGLRVGWIEFASHRMKKRFDSLGVIRSGSSICHFTSYVAVTSILCPEDLSPGSYSEGDGLWRHNCPFRSHLNGLRASLALKYVALLSSLQRYRLEYLSPSGPSNEFIIEGHPISSSHEGSTFSVFGGYFIWIYLPEWIGDPDEGHEGEGEGGSAVGRAKIMTSAQLLEMSCCSPYHLSFMLGATCCHTPPRREKRRSSERDTIRLCFAKLEVEELEEGARRLCQLLRDLQPAEEATEGR